MIVFRQVDEPYPDAGIHWNVECFDDDPRQQQFPIGTAYVVALRGAAQVQFVLVADQWRHRGVAKALVAACKERWPNLMYTGPMDEAGEGLLRSVREHFPDEEEH